MQLLRIPGFFLCSACIFLACTDGNRPSGRVTGPAPDSPVQVPKAGTPRRDSAFPPQHAPEPWPDMDTMQPSPLRPGRHDLTLQWIGWNKPGNATISAGEGGWYRIEGGQQSRDGDYLRIAGRIRVLNPKELVFEGRIETRVHFNNGGQPCVKEGQQRFLSTRGRKYWRLQNMAVCGEVNTVDYVDLYFK